MSVWDQIDQLKKKHAQTAAELKNSGDEYKFSTRPSELNALHWVARCRRRDCSRRDVVGTAGELPRLMKEHADAHGLAVTQADKNTAAARYAGQKK